MEIFKNRNFFILFSGQIVSTIGNNFYIIALPWFILSITHSVFDLTLTGIVQTLPSIAGLFVGVLIDRWDKRITMIVSDILRAMMALSMFLMTFLSDHITIIVFGLLVSVFLLQLFGNVFSPAFMSLFPKVVGEEYLTQANGLNQSGTAFAALTGRAAGGILITLVGAPILFLSNALSFILSVVSLLFVTCEKSVTTKRQSFVSEWLKGMTLIYRSKTIFGITLASIIANFASSALLIILVAWVHNVLKGASWMFGMAISFELIGIMVGGFILSLLTKLVPLKTVIVFGPIISGVCMSLIGVWVNVFWTALMLLMVGVCVGIFNGSTDAMLMDVVPDNVKGRVFSTGMALARLSVPLGVAMFGFLLLHLTLIFIFLICGIILVLAGVVLQLSIGKNINPAP